MVGYSTSTTVSEYGFTAIASTFTDVGSENEISLSSITGEFERGDSIDAIADLAAGLNPIVRDARRVMDSQKDK